MFLIKNDTSMKWLLTVSRFKQSFKSVSFYTLLLIVLLPYGVAAQITAEPSLPTASDEVVITFDATLGSGNLAGYTGDVYAHTGVIVEGSSDWQYVIGSWGNNSTQPKLTRVDDDTYTLTISPSIRDFYEVPDSKVIQKMCFVFRASSNSPQSENLFYDVYLEELNVVIISPTPTYPIFELNATIPVEVESKMATSLGVYLDNELLETSDGSPISTSITSNSYGKHWIKAVAGNGENSVADSVFFYIIGDVPVASLPAGVEPGVNVTGSNEVTLVLNDPPALKEFVFAIGDFNDWEISEEYLMNRTPDGTYHWVTIDDLNPENEYIYQYWIDGEIKLADPYTTKTSDPWNDEWIEDTNYPNLIEYPEEKTTGVASVFKINEEEYTWQTTDYSAPAKDQLVIYELHIRDFVDDDDIKSVRKKLDYLETLGVNAIELMPINEFEGNDSWGYNPSFYFAADKAYGTENDYKQFIDECHSRGIAVIIDMVLNHSYGLSPFVQMYFDENAGQWEQPLPENPWYNQTCPHEPWCWGYDFDHESEFTQDLIDKIAHYWLTQFKVDGFRFDFTKGFTNNQTANQGSNYDAARIGILKRYADYIWSVNPDAYVILEHFAENSEEKELANYGMLIWGNTNYNYNEATMGWLSNSDFSWVSYKQRGWDYPHLVGYMESHDEERLMYKNLTYGNSSNPEHDIKELDVSLERQKLAGMFFFTIPGPKMIWQFGELGYDYSINHCPDGTLSDNCRVSRKPIRWDYNWHENRKSLFYSWAEIIALRKGLPVFSTDNFSVSLSGAGKQIKLYHNDMDVVIVGNFDVTQQSVSVAFPNTGTWYEYFSQSSTTLESTETSITLNPGEYRMYSSVEINRDDYIVTSINTNTNESPLNAKVWPNPASNLLNVSVNSPEYTNAKISLVDITGRRVASIFEGSFNKGENLITWNRTNRIPSGLYLCVIDFGNRKEVIKITLQ